MDSTIPQSKPIIKPMKPAIPANLWLQAPRSPGKKPRKAKPPIIQASAAVFINNVIEKATIELKTAPNRPSNSQARTSLFN